MVDDEEDILNLLSYNLKKAGFEVVTAGDGPEALELAAHDIVADPRTQLHLGED